MVKTALAALAAVACYALPAHAAINDSADHSYLSDTATGLDWLDVTASVNMSFDQVSAQFGVGGTFEGWRYASGDEFNALI
jgi:hypothetical protein